MIKTNKNLSKIKHYLPSNREGDNSIKKLDWNECNIQFDSEYLSELKSSFNKINLSEYPNINNDELLNALSSYCSINKNKIQIFNGSDSALHYIFATFLNPETNVLIYYPSYSQVESYIQLYSNNLNYSKIINPFEEHTYNFNDINSNDVIYITNPNNPTGKVIDCSVIKELLIKYPNKLFIIDEAYFEFSDITCVSLVNDYNNIIITRTFSKAFSLASIRLGYICSNENNINEINKIRNTKEVNSFAQSLGIVALKNIHHIKNRINIINNNKEFFTNELKKLNIQFIDSMSNFVLIKVKDSKFLIKKLIEKGILVRDRSSFEGLENSVRISIGEIEDMITIINTIKEIYEY
jgi:histidinol-phosphate aminotransferase